MEVSCTWQAATGGDRMRGPAAGAAAAVKRLRYSSPRGACRGDRDSAMGGPSPCPCSGGSPTPPCPRPRALTRHVEGGCRGSGGGAGGAGAQEEGVSAQHVPLVALVESPGRPARGGCPAEVDTVREHEARGVLRVRVGPAHAPGAGVVVVQSVAAGHPTSGGCPVTGGGTGPVAARSV